MVGIRRRDFITILGGVTTCPSRGTLSSRETYRPPASGDWTPRPGGRDRQFWEATQTRPKLGSGGQIARSIGFAWTNSRHAKFSLPVTYGLRHNPLVQLRSMSCA